MFSHTGKVNAALLIALFLAVLLTALIFSFRPGTQPHTSPSASDSRADAATPAAPASITSTQSATVEPALAAANSQASRPAICSFSVKVDDARDIPRKAAQLRELLPFPLSAADAELYLWTFHSQSAPLRHDLRGLDAATLDRLAENGDAAAAARHISALMFSSENPKDFLPSIRPIEQRLMRLARQGHREAISGLWHLYLAGISLSGNEKTGDISADGNALRIDRAALGHFQMRHGDIADYVDIRRGMDITSVPDFLVVGDPSNRSGIAFLNPPDAAQDEVLRRAAQLEKELGGLYIPRHSLAEKERAWQLVTGELGAWFAQTARACR